MNSRKKLLLVAISMIVASTLVSATLLNNFGSIRTTMNVEQSVQIDGHNYDEPVEHQIDAIGGCCYCFEHEVTNQGCEGIWLDWEHYGEPDLDGIDISIVSECYLEHLDVSVLDGMAQYDDFEVYVDGILVYTYYAQGGSETWILHTIDLTPYQIPCYGTHNITIDCIAGTPWQYWQTYGQLGVDTIDLYCGCPCNPQWCDGVDIGKTASEAGHNPWSWGGIEPATSGGNWGGIDDCRATWAPTETTPPGSAATTWASVELTCDFCECDCEKPPMDLPFYLEPGETLEFCICYKLDMLIMPGMYTIWSQLIPAIVI